MAERRALVMDGCGLDVKGGKARSAREVPCRGGFGGSLRRVCHRVHGAVFNSVCESLAGGFCA